MKPNPKSQKRLKSPKRVAIIEAAIEEFLSNGFTGTSMDRIAEVAQVSKRTVYDHFSSKEELFQTIAEEILKLIDEMSSCKYDKSKTLEEQLLSIGNIFAQTITEERFIRLSKVVIGRFIQTEDIEKKTANAQSRLRRDLMNFLQEAQQDGRLEMHSAEQAATQFAGLIKEPSFWPAITAGHSPISERTRNTIVKSAVDIFLKFYALTD
ncbi:MAG: TetR/AcrR family transcriptional regulator [Spirochaetota bacterium]